MHTLANINNFPDGTPIDSVQAKIIGVFPRKEGQGAKGPWSIQDGELIDGTGNKLKIKVWNHPDIGPMKGKEVVIHSAKPGGLKVIHDEYKGKTTVKLEVSKNGQFQFIEVWNTQNGTPQAPAQPVQAGNIDVTSAVKVEITGDPAKANDDQLSSAKRSINRLGNLWLACYEEALDCARLVKEARGHDLTSDQFQACVSSLFIQSSKDGVVVPGGVFTLKKKEKPVAATEPLDEDKPF